MATPHHSPLRFVHQNVTSSRRRFVQTIATVLAAGVVGGSGAGADTPTPSPRLLIKPPRLRRGHVVGLISPGGAIFEPGDAFDVQETLADLGLRSRLGAHALDRRGYLAGSDADRAADVNAMFADPEIDAILALRGGWGCNRILPLLDYDVIRDHPKILVGFSDVTSLLLAIHARTGLVTFHGPVGISTWNDFATDSFRRVCLDGEAAILQNPRRIGPPLVQGRDPTDTLAPGRAEGWLVGGNLSVLVSMIGSGFLPEWNDHILFLEDTREEPYRIDRMLTQLSLAGVLQNARAVVFGACNRCEADDPHRSLSLREVLVDHLGPLGIPCFYGLLIGHTANKLTVPIGIRATVDAGRGMLTLRASAVR